MADMKTPAHLQAELDRVFGEMDEEEAVLVEAAIALEGASSPVPRWPVPPQPTKHARNKPRAHLPEAPPQAPDNVVLPAHYARYKIEPVRFSIENGLNGFQFNIVKYFLRHDAKNGLEDLLKGIRYGIMFLRHTAGDPDWWRPDPYLPQIREAYLPK